MKKNQGFTLIETIIYIALFSLLLGSAFVTAYNLIDGTEKLSAKTNIGEEATFVMRKLNWAFTGLDRTNPPTVSGLTCGRTLILTKVNFPGNPIIIRLNVVANSLEMNEAGGPFYPLTTPNVKVTCFKANLISASGSGPIGVSATTTINGIDFAVTKYIRK